MISTEKKIYKEAKIQRKNKKKIDLYCLLFVFSIFLKYQKCLRQIKKRPKWKKLKDGETEDFLTEEEEAQRKLFKYVEICSMCSLPCSVTGVFICVKQM